MELRKPIALVTAIPYRARGLEVVETAPTELDTSARVGAHRTWDSIFVRTSRSVATTAQGIALAASRQGDLAADLALSVGERVSRRARQKADRGT